MAYAEQFLIKVLYPNSSAKNFNDLRCEEHVGTTPKLPGQMVPTSDELHNHIMRAIHATFLQITVLEPIQNNIDPLNYGWVKDGDILKPKRVENIYPPAKEFPTYCNCKKKCDTKKCKCVISNVKCISYCKCKKDECVNLS